MEEEKVLSSSAIHTLPQEVLIHIISLIPLKEAVKSCILSTYWNNLWRPFQLELDFTSKENVSEIKTLLLKSSRSPQLWKFSNLSATKGGEEELHLDFSRGNHLESSSSFSLSFKPAEVSYFSSLKTLHLISVNQIATDFVSDLFSSCQVLESLKLQKCSGLKNVEVKANNSLDHFEVFDCPDIENIRLSCTNIKSFWYRGALPVIQIESCRSLVDVSLDLREGVAEKEFDCEDIIDLLTALKDIEVLSISGWLLEWMCSAGVVFRLLPVIFTKLKELRWSDSSMDLKKMGSLTCFLSITPFLESLSVKIDRKLNPIECPCFFLYWHEPHLFCDYETVNSSADQLLVLKTIQLEGFANCQEDGLVLLMDLLLKMAGGTLRSMTVRTEPDKETWDVIPKSQLKYTDGYNTREVVISSPNNDYFFRLIEQNKGFGLMK